MTAVETTATRELVLAIREQGTAVLVIEHDMRFIFNLCDRVAVLVRGEKLVEGTPETVQRDERVVAAYLGTPFEGEPGQAEAAEVQAAEEAEAAAHRDTAGGADSGDGDGDGEGDGDGDGGSAADAGGSADRADAAPDAAEPDPADRRQEGRTD